MRSAAKSSPFRTLAVFLVIPLLAAALAFLIRPGGATSPPDVLAVVCGGEPYVVLYSDPNYGGASRTICYPTNVSNLGSLSASPYCTGDQGINVSHWRDCVSSVKIRGTNVTSGGVAYLLACFSDPTLYGAPKFYPYDQGSSFGSVNVPNLHNVARPGGGHWGDKFGSFRWGKDLNPPIDTCIP